MKKILLSTLLFTLFLVGYSQGGFEFSHKRWEKFNSPKSANSKLDTAKFKLDKVSIPSTGTGLTIYGTPSFVTNFITLQYTNGSFVPTGSLTPGFEYSVILAHYNAQATQTTFTNYAGLGVFAVAGGTGSPLTPSFTGGVSISISSYGQVGYGYDFINKRGEFVAGLALPLNVIEQGIMSSIFWVKPQ